MAKTTQSVTYSVPGLGNKDAAEVAGILQDRLNALNDLALTLKHIHWNVVGPNFIAVHTMLDPQVDAVRLMVDDTAALDLVYAGVIESQRKAIESTEELDPVTQDMLIGHAEQLEQFHWFVRAHLETPSGQLKTTGTHTETQAASRTRKK